MAGLCHKAQILGLGAIPVQRLVAGFRVQFQESGNNRAEAH
jgi:hypothetical protein